MEDINSISIYMGGLLSFLMAIFHIFFPKIFRWERDFKKISTTNVKVLFTVHTALYLLFFGFALLSFIYTKELSRPEGLAFGIELAYALFWLWRTIWQVTYFRVERGNKFLTLHYGLAIVFFLSFVAYSLPILDRLQIL